MVDGLEGVCGISTGFGHSFAVTNSGHVFQWGFSFKSGRLLRPTIVEEFGGVRVRRVCVGHRIALAIGQQGELFSWGQFKCRLLGHGDEKEQPSPKRVEALRGIRVSNASIGKIHALALADDGLVNVWGVDEWWGRSMYDAPILASSGIEEELLPTPVEALRGVRVRSVVAASRRSYSVSDTGQMWAWGTEDGTSPILAMAGVFQLVSQS
jgi:E3 ubiquitin-protein ligase HERC2